MAFDFPNSPSNGTTYQPAGGPIYTFQNGTWLAGSINSLDITGGDARYINVTGDAMTGALTLAADPSTAMQAVTKQYVDNGYGRLIGEVVDYAGTTAPPRWLMCYGQAVSRTTYAALFAVISTTYGVGDNSTTFNLPDARGRASAGKDDMGGTSANRLTNFAGGLDGDVLGAAGGLENHIITLAQMASHNHTGATGTESADHTHNTAVSGTTAGVSANHTHVTAVSGTTGTVSVNHTHAPGSGVQYWNFNASGGGAYTMSISTGTTTSLANNTAGFSANHTHSFSDTSSTSGVNSVGHTHTFSDTSSVSGGRSAAHTHAITAEGSGTAHNNVQPTIVFNKIIYAGV